MKKKINGENSEKDRFYQRVNKVETSLFSQFSSKMWAEAGGAIFLLSILLWCHFSAAPTFQILPRLNIDRVAIAGFSSGGFFAQQMYLAHSEIFVGMATLSGGPYLCFYATPNTDQLQFGTLFQKNFDACSWLYCTGIYGQLLSHISTLILTNIKVDIKKVASAKAQVER